jgi:Caspase domain
MRICRLILVAATLLGLGSGVQAQQSDPNDKFNSAFEGAYARAKGACDALWSDHAFDSLRKKIPLIEDKPTFEMLKNTEKLKASDRPVADLAIKTLEKCRAGYAEVYATFLPPAVRAMIQGIERRQDANIAELYRRKITFGEFNIAVNRLRWEFSSAISGVQILQPDASPQEASNKAAAATKTAQQPKVEQKETPSIAQPRETRLALVVGNSGYVNLPKLSNPVNDARAVADVLEKMGYQTRLLLDASEQKIRREVRQFASDSTKADVALVFYAGHGAQVNGNNYLLPTDMDIPRTEVDIQFAGLKVDDLVK